MRLPPLRPAAALLAALCFGLVGYAVYLQHVDGLPPCPLCILQRYAFLGVSLFAGLAALVGSGLGARLLCGLSLLSGLAGVGVAARQIWIIHHPTISCGLDPIETFVNHLPPAQWLPQVFIANGECAAPLPPVLGVDIPVWSALWLAVVSLAAAALVWRAGRKDR